MGEALHIGLFDLTEDDGLFGAVELDEPADQPPKQRFDGHAALGADLVEFGLALGGELHTHDVEVLFGRLHEAPCEDGFGCLSRSPARLAQIRPYTSFVRACVSSENCAGTKPRGRDTLSAVWQGDRDR
jgi:hypothetical protein